MHLEIEQWSLGCCCYCYYFHCCRLLNPTTQPPVSVCFVVVALFLCVKCDLIGYCIIVPCHWRSRLWEAGMVVVNVCMGGWMDRLIATFLNFIVWKLSNNWRFCNPPQRVCWAYQSYLIIVIIKNDLQININKKKSKNKKNEEWEVVTN